MHHMSKAELRAIAEQASAPVTVLKARKTASVKLRLQDDRRARDCETGEIVKPKRYEQRAVAAWQKQLPVFQWDDSFTREVHIVRAH